VTDELYSIACHEAGHAVAAYVRGGSVDSMTIKPDGDHLGLTVTTLENASDRSFAIYAGLWAETRLVWPLPTLEGECYGRTFEDCIELARLTNPYGDGELYVQSLAFEEYEGGLFVRDAREWTWNEELENYWPAIKAVADILLRDSTATHADIKSAVEGSV